MSRIAVAHKDYDVRGGGEILAEELARGLDAPLYVGHGDDANAPESPAVDIREVGPQSSWHRLADAGGLPRALGHMMLWRDHAPDVLDEFDVVVTSGNEPQWWTPRDTQAWVAYTHSTPRWLYDLFNDESGWLNRTVLQLKRWVYQQEVWGPDLWVCNSDLVARRVSRYWDVDESDIRVVYPPVDTERLSPDHAETQDYFLSVSRLDGNKRVGEIIEAANNLGVPLKVAGTGPEEDRLREMAGPTVEMLGWVDGQEKRELFAGARATVVACRNEDFGIVPIESLASGTPVVTVDDGFPPLMIPDGKAGVTFDRGRLEWALRAFDADALAWSDAQRAEYARENFSTERFHTEMRECVREAERRARVEPDLEPPATERVSLEADD